jgi:diadenosine tetraphosphate (Ap4A) HIT family hydrolase
MEGLNIIQNNGAIAKQVIMHYHMHLIPRYIKSTGMAKDKIEDTANKLLHPEFLIK